MDIHGKINLKYYNSDFQKLIDLLLKKNYIERPTINLIDIKYLETKHQLNNNDNNAKNYIDKYDIKFLKREQFRADIKIVVIGEYSTNKTQFVNRWTKNNFNETYKATIVSEFGFKIYEYDGRLYRIQLWDLAGQDRNAALIEIFGKHADGAIIMSDATDIDTRNNAMKWKNTLDSKINFIDGGNLPNILVENNIDLLPKEEEEDELGLQEFSQKNGFIGGFRISSKTGKNVDEAMDFLIKNIIKRKDDFEDKNLTIIDKKIIITEIDRNLDKYKNRKKDNCLLL